MRRALIAGRFTLALSISAVAALVGCAQESYYLHRPQSHAPSDAVLPWKPDAPRTLAMFEGDTGRIATWYDLMEGIWWADVVFVGETHTDMAGHRVELAIVDDTLAAHPGTVVSMEMFERDHQAALDEYLAGTIDLAALIERAKTRRWEFKEVPEMKWENSYQPIVDAAKAQGARVVASNAPREFTRIAKSDGYDALRALPPDKQALFNVPTYVDHGRYRHRFNETMSEEKLAPSAEKSEYDAIFRAQQVWDATMATSIARELDKGAKKVVHIVGQFHVEWRGGIVGQLRALRPQTKILVVTIVPDDADELAPDDAGRADVVIYSGKRPEPPTTETSETEPAPESTPTPAGEQPAPSGETPATDAPSAPATNPHQPSPHQPPSGG
ncbi:MAG: ChaN family lipoprotein [Phycisphaerales bacterium]